MKLINPSKLIEEINKLCKIDGQGYVQRGGLNDVIITQSYLIKAIEASTVTYPYLNDTGVNIKNQNGW